MIANRETIVSKYQQLLELLPRASSGRLSQLLLRQQIKLQQI